VLILLLLFIVFPEDGLIFLRTIKTFFVDFWWLTLPLPIWYIYDVVWNEYIENEFVSKFNYVLLELIPPKDIEKNPKLMEHVFTGIHDYSTPDKFEIHCGWRMFQPKLSFEIANDDKGVHFYIRCPVNMRDNIEAHIYAQYPEMVIKPVEDYTLQAPKNLPNRNWDVWGSVIVLGEPDPVPIRTYKQFQEDVTGEVIDPLAHLIEVMDALPRHQHIWLQINVTSEKPPNWHPASKAYIQQLIDEHLGKTGGKKTNKLVKLWKELAIIPNNFFKGFFGKDIDAPAGLEDIVDNVEFDINKLPPGVKETVLAISENISKPGFWTVIRFIYFGKRGPEYNKALGVAGVFGTFNQFGDVNLNSFVPHYLTKTRVDYYFDKERLLYRKRKIVADYRGRAFSGLQYIMNTEELATIFHFPNQVVKTSAVTRVESKKENAPSDLPIGDFQENGETEQIADK